MTSIVQSGRPSQGAISRRTFSIGFASMVGFGMFEGMERANATPVTAADCHAHIFKRGLKLAESRRYAPDYDAPLEAYLKNLDANGLSHGVAVQPSFLGTDNSYLLEGLSAAKGRLRGIAVVDPSIPVAELKSLDERGVAGIRLNLAGQPIPPFDAEPWPGFLKQIAKLGWQVEVQRDAKDLAAILPTLLNAGVTVVCDHFGKPDSKLGVNDPGFRVLLETGAKKPVWAKISGFYRIGKGEDAKANALAAYPMLRDAFGLEHLVWGSDWPHTQFEKDVTYAEALQFLNVLVPSESERAQILGANAAKLFRFIA